MTAGDRLTNPTYAAFLRRLAAQGSAAMYGGETAARIVARTRAAPLGGSMTMADLANYKPVKRDALCRPVRVYVACVPPPPSSGVGLLQLMMLLERTDIAARGPSDPQAWFLFAEASRIMYADRDRYVADPAFVKIPVEGMLDPAYVDARARLIGPVAGPAPAAGQPAGALQVAADRTHEVAGTSHFIVRDSAGNVVSMTTTVESIFGSGRMVDGFFLNNQMTDFSFAPLDDSGRPMANAVAPGKRPRSSMTPMILLTPDRPLCRSDRICRRQCNPGICRQVARRGDRLETADAAGAWLRPNLVARGSRFNGEVTKFSPDMLEALRAKGIDLRPGQGEDSGVHGVLIRDGKVDGGYDPRREGVVLLLGR